MAGKGSPVIVKRVKKGGHAHHGGSWKVAYADFVTAMMAFFMVMWIIGMDESTRQAVEGYFSNPAGYKKGYGSGASPIGKGAAPMNGPMDRMKFIIHSAENRSFKEAAEKIRTGLDSTRGSFGKARFEVAVTESGLRIELIEDGSGENFFPRGSAELKPAARVGLGIIARELRTLRNPIALEGHTDAATYGEGATYSNWELSSDRANAARRILESLDVDPKRVVEVRGFADTRLRRPENPLSAENRRITILLPFSEFRKPAEMDPAKGVGAG